MSLTPEEVGDTRRTMEEHLRSISTLQSSVEVKTLELCIESSQGESLFNVSCLENVVWLVVLFKKLLKLQQKYFKN